MWVEQIAEVPQRHRPDQDSAVLIKGQVFGIDEFFLQIVQVGVVQCKPPFERPIRDTLLALQHLDDLGQDLFKSHCHPSICYR